MVHEPKQQANRKMQQLGNDTHRRGFVSHVWQFRRCKDAKYGINNLKINVMSVM